MASEFNKLNENDTKELRKELGLPITKELIYWRRIDAYSWKQIKIVDYEIVQTYMPSGSKSLLISLENGEQVRIHGDYLSDMQKATFLDDIGQNEKPQRNVPGKIGKRIENYVDKYVVVDLETTGLNHNTDEIIQIGAIKYENGKEIERFDTLVKTDLEISRKIEKLTGISNDLLMLFGVDASEALSKLKEFLGDSIVVGHNFAAFDSKFLEDAYGKLLDCHFPNDYIDTLYLAKEKRKDLKQHSLEKLANEYNIDYSKAHRAVEDCVINHFVYEYLAFGCLSNDDTNDDTNDDDLVEVTVFDGWQAELKSKFDEIETEYELLSHTLSIMANYRGDGTISSYAVCAFEPDLVDDKKASGKTTVMARIYLNKLKSMPNVVEIKSRYLSEDKRFDKASAGLVECITECIRSGIDNYEPKADSFACCSRYKECSEAGKCVHPNKLYAKACQYRKNVEAGNIFY